MAGCLEVRAGLQWGLKVPPAAVCTLTTLSAVGSTTCSSSSLLNVHLTPLLLPPLPLPTLGLNQICMDWLGKLLHLPPCLLSEGGGAGVIQSSASEATLVALLSAKARAMQGRAAEDALRLCVYCSDQAHSSGEPESLAGWVVLWPWQGLTAAAAGQATAA